MAAPKALTLRQGRPPADCRAGLVIISVVEKGVTQLCRFCSARLFSVVDSKRRILATRPCAETDRCDFAMRVLMAQEIEELAYGH